MDSKPEESQYPVDEGSSDHKARVKRTPNDTPKGIPTLRVKPVPELVKTFLSQVQSRSVIEIGIEFVDHALVS